MTSKIDELLVQLNSELTQKVLDLEAQLAAIRVSKDSSTCPLCKTGKCDPHRIINESQNAEAVLILEEENDDLGRERDELKRHVSELSKQISVFRDKNSAVIDELKRAAFADYDEVKLQLSAFYAFLHKTASRLGVRIDSTYEKNISMVDDALRKLLK